MRPMKLDPADREKIATLRRLETLPPEARSWLEFMHRRPGIDTADRHAIRATLAEADRRAAGIDDTAPGVHTFGQDGAAEYERRYPKAKADPDDATAFWDQYATDGKGTA